MNIEPNKSIGPSWFSRLRGDRVYHWGSVVTCQECGLTGVYVDFHPIDPCFNCGNKAKRECVGRWRSKWWQFWGGHWELKG